METDVTRSIEEQLSAFLDGELPDEELQLLVRRLEREESFRATLVRYSLLGNILRNDPIQSSSEPFRASIMAALSDASEIAEAEPLAVPARFSWAKRLASAAVIALVFVGIVNMDLFDNFSESDITRFANAEQAGIVNATTASSQQPRLDRRAAINQERLTSYLVSHSERARPFQGAMADSRIFIQQASFEQ
jgi:negative regulator of sigma E activity